MQVADFHALTGWIPELYEIGENDSNSNADDLFNQLRNGLSRGRCLVIVMSSHKIPEEELTRAGIVGRHAYAVLDMQEIDVSWNQIEKKKDLSIFI